MRRREGKVFGKGYRRENDDLSLVKKKKTPGDAKNETRMGRSVVAAISASGRVYYYDASREMHHHRHWWNASVRAARYTHEIREDTV